MKRLGWLVTIFGGPGGEVAGKLLKGLAQLRASGNKEDIALAGVLDDQTEIINEIAGAMALMEAGEMEVPREAQLLFAMMAGRIQRRAQSSIGIVGQVTKEKLDALAIVREAAQMAAERVRQVLAAKDADASALSAIMPRSDGGG